MLVEPGLHAFGATLRQQLVNTVKIVLEITEHPDLLTPQSDSKGQSSSTFLAEKLSMRSTYITPLNIIQVENLKRLRAIESGEVSEEFMAKYAPSMPWSKEMLSLDGKNNWYHATVSDTLIITMKGIAAGMQNTG